MPARLRLCPSSPICSIWAMIALMSIGAVGDAPAYRGLQQRPEHVAHPVQPLDHLGPVGAVAQHLAEALVQRAARRAAVHRVAQHEDPHRRADHAGHRADGAVVVARLERDAVAGGERRLGGLGVSAPGPRRASRRSARRAAARTRGPSRSAARRAGTGRARRPSASDAGTYVDELGAGGRASASTAVGVGRGAPRVGDDAGQGVLDADLAQRRAPVDLGDRHRLRRAARRRTAAAPTATTRSARQPCEQAHGVVDLRRPGRRRAGRRRRWTGTPRRRPRAAARPGVASPAGRRPVRGQRHDHGELPAGVGGRCADRRQRRGQLGGRVGVRAVAEHDVEQQHRARSGRPPRRRSGRSAVRWSIIGCGRPWVSASSPKSIIAWPVGPQVRRRGPSSGRSGMLDRIVAERGGGDDHRLVAQRAAAEQPAQRARRAAGCCWSSQRPRLGPGAHRAACDRTARRPR